MREVREVEDEMEGDVDEEGASKSHMHIILLLAWRRQMKGSSKKKMKSISYK